MKKQILVVEDEKDMQFILANILKEKGYETIIAGDGRGALKEVKKGAVNLVLLDLNLPGMDGIKVLEKIKEIDKDLFFHLFLFNEISGPHLFKLKHFLLK